MIRIYSIYGDTESKCYYIYSQTTLVIASQLLRDLFSLLDSIIDVPNHVEGTFREI